MTKSKSPQRLKDYSNIFEFRDWNYTRNTNLKQIHYVKGFDNHNNISTRLKQAAYWMFGKTPEWYEALKEKNSLSKRFGMAKYSLKRDPNLPDGVLDSGSIIAFWEETGEYLQMVQPTVGSLVADFLLECPEHPHAIKITKELDRINRAYTKRIKEDGK